ncbi:hypothetical protein DF186_23220, partial [Enterococcus hirae]
DGEHRPPLELEHPLVGNGDAADALESGADVGDGVGGRAQGDLTGTRERAPGTDASVTYAAVGSLNRPPAVRRPRTPASGP